MIVQSKGFQIDGFKIPPFQLKKGEIIILYLGNSLSSARLKEKLFQLFAGTEKNSALILNKDLTVVENVLIRGLKEKFFPSTVKSYVYRKAKFPKENLEKITTFEEIAAKTKISHLPCTPRKLISLFCTFSHSDKIIFDLAGLDPLGSEKVFKEVKNQIEDNDGAAIFLASFLGFEDKCSQFIKIKK